jgi:myo-inositol 2-dehydrogenase / D-chiro-inositol 1-dehydrogenase
VTKKPIETAGALTRRAFVQRSAAGAAVVGAPLVLPARLLAGGPAAPANRVRVGHIGAGRIAQGHDMPGVIGADLADVLAVCDLDARRAESGKSRVERLVAARNTRLSSTAPVPPVSVFTDYREMLERSDLDAVTISLPDHQHAEVALRALYAGKDVYLQKPFTMTHAEGLVLRDAVARTGRILSVGSQQRSWGPNEQFRKAVELVRSGRVGTLQRVEIGLPTDPTAPDSPPEPVPPHLNYDLWLGPTPEVYYTEQRVHPQRMGPNGPDVNSRPGWLRNENYSLGMITGWGAHHFDTAHWGMDLELSGPTKIEGKGEFPTNKIWNVHGAYDIELTYPGNIRMRVSDKLPNGIKFIGTEGWIFVSRDAQQATASDPAVAPTALKSLDASNPKLLDPNGLKVQIPSSTSHHKSWLECVTSRKEPLAPAPIAHRSNTACILAWIAMRTGRPLTWDAKAERFVNDAEANAMLTRPERGQYGALKLAAQIAKTKKSSPKPPTKKA